MSGGQWAQSHSGRVALGEHSPQSSCLGSGVMTLPEEWKVALSAGAVRTLYMSSAP